WLAGTAATTVAAFLLPCAAPAGLGAGGRTPRVGHRIRGKHHGDPAVALAGLLAVPLDQGFAGAEALGVEGDVPVDEPVQLVADRFGPVLGERVVDLVGPGVVGVPLDADLGGAGGVDALRGLLQDRGGLTGQLRFVHREQHVGGEVDVGGGRAGQGLLAAVGGGAHPAEGQRERLGLRVLVRVRDAVRGRVRLAVLDRDVDEGRGHGGDQGDPVHVGAGRGEHRGEGRGLSGVDVLLAGPLRLRAQAGAVLSHVGQLQGVGLGVDPADTGEAVVVVLVAGQAVVRLAPDRDLLLAGGLQLHGGEHALAVDAGQGDPGLGVVGVVGERPGGDRLGALSAGAAGGTAVRPALAGAVPSRSGEQAAAAGHGQYRGDRGEAPGAYRETHVFL